MRCCYFVPNVKATDFRTVKLTFCHYAKLRVPWIAETYNSCGYTRLLPEVTQWVIALGWDLFGFLVRFSPPVTLQIITQGQLLTWRYLAGNLIHHGDRKLLNVWLACGCSSVSYTTIPGRSKNYAAQKEIELMGF